MAIYLGVDVGTQSVKTLAIDGSSGALIASAQAPLDLISGEDGARAQMASWWLSGLQDCLSQLDSPVRNAIAAIGVSGQQHGFVPLDARGNVLAPVKLWCDTATTAECLQITEAFGGTERCISEVGNAILPGYTASKIRWLKNCQPDQYRQLRSILLPHDYINFYLTGERVMECGDASGTGLLDIRQRRWHDGMLAALDSDRDLRDCMPELVSADAVIGKLRSAVAQELGLPAGIPVSAGGGDNMMAAIGTGNVVPGKLTISLGTSGTLFAYSDSPIVDNEGAVAAFCDSTGGWLPLLCTMNCTVATELTRTVFQCPLEELERRVNAVPAGAHGVLTLPFFNGERTPNLPDGKGCIQGLDPDNYTPENLMRSAMESAVYGLRAGLDIFREQGLPISEIRVTGGGSGSPTWCQMIADVFDLPVSVQQIDEGAALGAALQACWVHQRAQGEPVELVDLVNRCVAIDPAGGRYPVPETAGAYAAHYQRYLRHVKAITHLY